MSLIKETFSTFVQAKSITAEEINALYYNQGAAITEAEVTAAQKAWCDGLVAVSNAYSLGNSEFLDAAKNMITALYDYKTPDGGKVFFKPTLANGTTTFRPTFNSALSYFVGSSLVNDPAYPDDSGFATNGWTEVTFDNSAGSPYYGGIQIYNNIAITMGNVFLKNASGTTQVDKTFVFRRASDGTLRIVLHKSALSLAAPPSISNFSFITNNSGNKYLRSEFVGNDTATINGPSSAIIFTVFSGSDTWVTVAGDYTLTVANPTDTATSSVNVP